MTLFTHPVTRFYCGCFFGALPREFCANLFAQVGRGHRAGLTAGVGANAVVRQPTLEFESARHGADRHFDVEVSHGSRYHTRGSCQIRLSKDFDATSRSKLNGCTASGPTESNRLMKSLAAQGSEQISPFGQCSLSMVAQAVPTCGFDFGISRSIARATGHVLARDVKSMPGASMSAWVT